MTYTFWAKKGTGPFVSVDITGSSLNDARKKLRKMGYKVDGLLGKPKEVKKSIEPRAFKIKSKSKSSKSSKQKNPEPKTSMVSSKKRRKSVYTISVPFESGRRKH